MQTAAGERFCRCLDLLSVDARVMSNISRPDAAAVVDSTWKLRRPQKCSIYFSLTLCDDDDDDEDDDEDDGNDDDAVVAATPAAVNCCWCC